MVVEPNTVRIYVPARVADFLYETQCGYDLRAGRETREPADLVDVVQQIINGKPFYDGSYSLEVTPDRLDVLEAYGDYLCNAAGDSAGPDDMSALAELNAGRARVRRVHVARQAQLARRHN